MADFIRGAKTTGSKFYFQIGQDALDEFNTIVRMVNYHIEHGYTFVIPPYLVNQACAEQAGILPRFKGDFYETTEGLLLIPTAETPLVGMHSDEILKEEDLPIKYVALSPCFRKEAGSHGARDKGLKRVHQFHKVELFHITKPESSEAEHAEIVNHVCKMIDTLFPKIEYRQVELSKEDRSPVSEKTVDIEVLCEGEWLEVSSISNTKDNQSKLAQIRYKPKSSKKNVKCHLLNGSGLALPRLLLTLKESNKNGN